MNRCVAAVALVAAVAFAFTVYSSPQRHPTLIVGVTRRRHPLADQEARHG